VRLQDGVAAPIVLERGAGVVRLEAVELHDDFAPKPHGIHLLAGDPEVQRGLRQTARSAKGGETVLES
jgi:hypothetical protein